MHPPQRSFTRSAWALLCLLIVGPSISLLGSACAQHPAPAPAIELTTVPEATDGGSQVVATIAGRVTGARPGQQIVLFARSGVWWVQPFAAAPFTAIKPDATFTSATHLGMEYAALLVEPGYKPPARADSLPRPGGGVVAVTVAKGRPSAGRPQPTLHFSGYDWHVRQVGSDRGGRPNDYDPTNAWVDANGFLHLRIARRADQWTSAEVRLTRSLGYGTYRFVVRDIAHLEPHVVLGLFTWDDQASEHNFREIDIEITRWGDAANKNAQFVVQPYYIPANVSRFIAPAGVLTHAFRWEPGRVSLKTMRGADAESRAKPVAEHVFTSGVPVPGAELVHMNLYIFGNVTQPLQNGTEVVIEKFQYLP